MAAIGQMPRAVLNTISVRHAIRLSARKRSTLACSNEVTSNAEPPHPRRSSQCSVSQFTRAGYRAFTFHDVATRVFPNRSVMPLLSLTV
jgi:hypothetical protein